MSTQKVIVIKCDGCGYPALSHSMSLRDLLHLATPAPSTVTEARAHAATKGWRHTSAGNDYCPDCQGEKRPPLKRHLLDHIPHPHLPHWGAH